MTVNQIASILCKMEGNKSQVKIGDMRETLKLLVLWETAVNIKAVETGPDADGNFDMSESPLFCLVTAVKAKLLIHRKKQAAKVQKEFNKALDKAFPEKKSSKKKAKKISKKR